jgi:hypothetical protein
VCFTPDGAFAAARLARIYLKIPPDAGVPPEPRADRMQARDCVDEIVSEAPGAAVTLLLDGIEQCRGAKHVALLAAGPLESLLARHGPSVIDALERAARNSSKVRYLLSGTWGRSRIDPGVWQRLVAAVAAGPVMDADARTPAAGLHDEVIDLHKAALLLAGDA